MPDKNTPINRTQAALLLQAPSGKRPRIYGQVSSDSEILAIRSQYDLDRFPDVHILWLSGTTLADLIRKA